MYSSILKNGVEPSDSVLEKLKNFVVKSSTIKENNPEIRRKLKRFEYRYSEDNSKLPTKGRW